MNREARKAPAREGQPFEAKSAAAYCREKAAQCRRLVRMINDPVAVAQLDKIIAEFEARAAALEAEETDEIGRVPNPPHSSPSRSMP